MNFKLHILLSIIYCIIEKWRNPLQKVFLQIEAVIIKDYKQHTYMIIDFTINFNTYENKILTAKRLYPYTCPKCGSKHALTRHATYQRNISYFKENYLYNDTLTILRLKCGSCHSTHAILPNDIIPYCIYSYCAIIKILTEYYVKKKSVLLMSNTYSVSFQLIYAFIHRFLAFLKACTLVLRVNHVLTAIDTPSAKEVFASITHYSLKSHYHVLFFHQTNWLFLMKKFHNTLDKSITIGAYTL